MRRCYSCFYEYNDEYDVCPYCGQLRNVKPKEAIQLSPGTVLAGRYLIGYAVGTGGFGIIYKAWDQKLETIVAVKEFYSSRLVSRAEGSKNLIVIQKTREEFEYRKNRFLAEARNMAKFGAHRAIPNVFEFFEENNTAYIVMELLEGVALNDYLRESGGKIDIDFAILIAKEVGAALTSLHKEGIIHRDVAPDNIFICSQKNIKIKLLDLGAAQLSDEERDVIDIVLKPGYSPAEQYDKNQAVGPWMDIYAFGATMYMLVTGVKPEESTDRKIQDNVLPPHELNSDVPENMSNAIMKAMAIEKHMRFKTVNEFVEALCGDIKVIPLKKEIKKRKIRRFSGISAACLALIVAAIILVISLSNKRAEESLDPADISVWFSVADGSTEEVAMQSVIDDFQSKFPDVNIELRAIPESQYREELIKASKENRLPSLFESTDIPDDLLRKAEDLTDVLKSEQAKECLFLEQYDRYYTNNKKMPLAIVIPVAYVITSGPVYLEYTDDYFSDVNDFGVLSGISADDRYESLVRRNFGDNRYRDASDFLNSEANTSAVLFSSSMIFNEVRQTLVKYEKRYVYYNADRITCDFTYEWSIGNGEKNEVAAAEKLLSWMLGNVYQNTLMISECSDGQIPINETCFFAKIENRNFLPIKGIYEKFVFENEE